MPCRALSHTVSSLPWCRTSGDKHREASLANGLKTSLLIPTFQMSALKQDPQGRGKEIADPAIAGARRPFSFFYLRNEDRADPTPGSCGMCYTCACRLYTLQLCNGLLSPLPLVRIRCCNCQMMLVTIAGQGNLLAQVSILAACKHTVCTSTKASQVCHWSMCKPVHARMYTADLAPCQVPDMSGTGSAAGYEESWGYSSIARLMSSGEISIADRTQLDKYGRRIKSAKGPRSTLDCNSDNGSGATNGAQALHQQEAMRSTAEIVYRFGLDFALKDVVRSSAAAPTYFPREHPGCWSHITAFKAERLVGTTRAPPRPCHGC